MKNPFATIVAAGLLAFLPCIALAGEKEDQENLAREANLKQAVVAEKEHAAQRAAAQREAADKLAALQADVRKQTGLVDVTPEAVRHLISTLQEQREQLELDEAGYEGRRQGLEDAVARLSKQLDDRVSQDEVSKALSAVVSTRQAQLDRIKSLYKTGAAPMAEMDQAEANLAQARAEVAAARQKALSSASAEALDGWNRQLLEVTIAAQERLGRLKYIDTRLRVLSNAVESLDQIEKLRSAANDQTRIDDLTRIQLDVRRDAAYSDFVNWLDRGSKAATEPSPAAEK